jgi:hypothetical protein
MSDASLAFGRRWPTLTDYLFAKPIVPVRVRLVHGVPALAGQGAAE